MPSGARHQSEAITRGFGGADAPARRRSARFQCLRRPQQEEGQAGIGGGKMQPLARFQIEPVDAASDGGRRIRAHRLLDRPQRVFVPRGLDQDYPRRIKSERAQPMTIGPAMVTEAVGRKDEDDLFPSSLWRRGGWGVVRRRESIDPWVQPAHPHPLPTRGRGEEAAQNRRDEAEGGGAGVRSGHDFMQGAAGKAAIRQAGIDGGEAKRQGCA